MNKNQNIAMGISLAVVAIMVGSAEIFGEKEIIFPEITAVAMGALIAPVQSWNTSRTRLFAAIVSAAVAGVCIVRFIPEILILRIALGLLIAVSVITLSKTSFVPAVSACILPILMGTKSPVYVISVAVMTAFILIFKKFLNTLVCMKSMNIDLSNQAKSFSNYEQNKSSRCLLSAYCLRIFTRYSLSLRRL